MKDRKFTVDWFSNNIRAWDQLFSVLDLKNKPNLHFLEIGCYEGRSTTWLLDNILTDDSSMITVIDTFAGSPEEDGMKTFEFDTLEERFRYNIKDDANKVKILKGYSQDVLRQIIPSKGYDFIYIDGTHTAYGTLEDAVLCHQLIKEGGIMLFDDFGWKDPNRPEPYNSPELAVSTFANVFAPFYDVVMTGYQVALQRKLDKNVVL